MSRSVTRSTRLAVLDRRPWLWLLLGMALIAVTHLRGGVGLFVWVAPIPLLRYLRVTRGVRSRLMLFAALVGGWSLAFLKIADPFPVAAIPLWGIGLAVFQVLPYALHDALGRRLPPAWGALVFPAGLAVAEWVQHALTPFGSWAATAYTQLDNLPLLQMLSVTGMAGVAFLIGWVGSLGEAWLAGAPGLGRSAAIAAAALITAQVAGSARLAATSGGARPTTLVAAIDTDATTAGLPLPSRAETAEWDRRLGERTERAGAAGAKLVVWPEVATLVLPEDEAAWLERLAALAGRARVDVVAGYLVPLTLEPLRYENKYAFARADGTLDHTYNKNFPVPGEPATPGTGPAPRVTTAYGIVSGAICYDYDFPSAGRARAGVDLVALPSSDWRAIDPVHTQMAALRAIESGHSIVRATRFGLSAGVDPEGRLRGWMSHFDHPARGSEAGVDAGADGGVLLVELPRSGSTTLYGLWGDWFVGLLGAGLVVAVVQVARARRGGASEAPATWVRLDPDGPQSSIEGDAPAAATGDHGPLGGHAGGGGGL